MDYKSIQRDFMGCQNIILEQPSYNKVNNALMYSNKNVGVLDIIFAHNLGMLKKNEWLRNRVIASAKDAEKSYPNHLLKLAEVAVVGGNPHPADVLQIKSELKEEILKWFHKNKKSMHYKHGIDAVPISSRLGGLYLVLLFCQQEGLPIKLEEIGAHVFSFMETEYSGSLVAKRMKGNDVKPIHPDNVKDMGLNQAMLFFKEFIQDGALLSLMADKECGLSASDFANNIVKGHSSSKKLSKEIDNLQREIDYLQSKKDNLSNTLAKLDAAKASMSQNALDGISGVPGIRKLLSRVCSDIKDNPELYVSSDIALIQEFARSCIEQ